MPVEYAERRFDPREQLAQRGSLIEETPGFQISPRKIDASRHLYDAYGNSETEASAGYVIRMFQQIGSWRPFTAEEIEQFYRQSGHTDGFTFNQLVEPGMGFGIIEGRYPMGGGWIVFKDGKYHLTTTFVEAAFKSSPKTSHLDSAMRWLSKLLSKSS